MLKFNTKIFLFFCLELKYGKKGIDIIDETAVLYTTLTRYIRDDSEGYKFFIWMRTCDFCCLLECKILASNLL